jgi:hypothetical protein
MPAWEPRTIADLERARDRVEAAERRIDNERTNNPNSGQRSACHRILCGGQVMQMTGGKMRAADQPQLRLLRPAALEGVWAARMEAAPFRRVDRARHVAFENDALAHGTGLRDRSR